jgi:hypothetical protein
VAGDLPTAQRLIGQGLKERAAASLPLEEIVEGE